MIQTVNFKKYYGKNRGVEDLTLHVKAGEIYGFVGPNGAGKSTTIRSLLGMLKPTSGELLLFERPCTDRNLSEVKDRIGYLPSENHYYDRLRVKELFEYAAGYRKKDCSGKIRELCEILALDTSRLIEDLSFGNKKKVGIVLSMMHEPELLILDEPTVGLDPLMQNHFYDLLRKEKSRGATVFFSSHILSEVQRLCDRVGIIKEGRLIDEKDVKELRQTQYKKVFIKLQNGTPFRPGEAELTELTEKSGEVRFIYQGNAGDLTRLLASNEIADFSVTEPDLEEVFMHYYREDEK